MNTYAKYCPNVFVAKCDEEHERGEIIPVTTKYGKENDCIVFNLVKKDAEHFYYSIVRADGMNRQEYIKKKAEKYEGYAQSADKKASNYYEKSNQYSDFLSLGEPIKVGHHSEAGHRRMIESTQNNTRRMVEYMDKAEGYKDKAESLHKRENVIDLSMPESIEYFEEKLEKAVAYHKGLKEGTIPRPHSYALTYANNEVKDLKEKVRIAKLLWEEPTTTE